MLSRNPNSELLRRYNYDYEISFLAEKHFRKKRFRKHYIRLAHLSIVRFLNLRHYADML